MHSGIPFLLLSGVNLLLASVQVCDNNHLYNITDVGIVTSPSFPELYPNGKDCYQVLSAENEDDVIQLIFYMFDTEKDADYVYLYEGEGANKTLIARLTGDSETCEVYRTNYTNTMTIRFKSDLDNNFDGFYAEYRPVPKDILVPVLDDAPIQTKEYNETSGVLITPKWPDLYPNSACWLYHFNFPYNSITFKFNTFSTEPNADFLYIYHENETDATLIEKKTGFFDKTTTLAYTDQNILLKFTSDLDGQSMGFSITYKTT
ncbi:unnamed protein product [Bursaphelenchus okinawaensis]|uniref:CUB domain-containing protein n=1 Tax=Bursaphelenchus okinawaensis TaxID=465554 RepID=A0A811LA85_9BILA|nr:unnamed protein product [Bursaphelenchus okinawaensis]CAG9120010.1 unnamed protein product [Bursaphelenchus okinawaensis]